MSELHRSIGAPNVHIAELHVGCLNYVQELQIRYSMSELHRSMGAPNVHIAELHIGCLNYV